MYFSASASEVFNQNGKTYKVRYVWHPIFPPSDLPNLEPSAFVIKGQVKA
jgi:hypothetical protein